MNTNQIDKFYSYLQELEQSYGKLSELLQRKAEVVAQQDLVKLDEIIKEEQVYVLQAKGFDNNLLLHRDKLGLDGDTLAEVIEELPAERREAFRLLHKRLKNTLDQVSAINQKCQTMLEDRLYSLDRAIKSLDQSESTTYKKTGNAKVGPDDKPNLFTKTI